MVVEKIEILALSYLSIPYRYTKMTTITAKDVLAARESGSKFGHSPRADGEFMARVGCPCYNCRSCLDPTGEEDAAAANAQSSNLSSSLSNTSTEVEPVIDTSILSAIGRLSASFTGDYGSEAYLDLPPPPPLVRVSAFRQDNIFEAIHSLKREIEELTDKQEAIYERKADSHDEMAAQDTEWTELDTKIAKLNKIVKELYEL